MDKKAMIYLGKYEKDRLAEVKGKVSEILSEYPDCVLVKANEEQIQLLKSQGFKIETLENNRTIKVGGYEFTTDEKIERPASIPSALSLSTESIGIEESNYFIVQFIGPIKKDWKTEVEKLGGKIYESVPNYAFIVGMDMDTKKKVEKLDFVQWVGIYQPAYKINLRLRSVVPMMQPSVSPFMRGIPKKEKKQIGGNIEIVLFEPEDIPKISQEIERSGGKVLSKVKNRMIVDMDTSNIQEIAKNSEVKLINPYTIPRLHNNVAVGIIDAEPISDVKGLDGDGQIVAVADTGIDNGVNDATMSDDFEGRIVSIHSWPIAPSHNTEVNNPGADDGPSDLNGHGTHVAGSVLGNGSNSNGKIRGIAPAAQLVFQAIEQFADLKDNYEDPDGRYLVGIPDDLNDLYQQAYDDGARIHSNSWGSIDPVDFSAYTGRSEDTDEFMWNNRDFLILRSAGNNAPGADTIGPPGTAKNCLTVGASESERLTLPNTVNFPASPSHPSGATWIPPGPLGYADNRSHIADFSSRGPTDDERIKPDVVAPGTWILSTRSSVCVADTGPDGLPDTDDENGVETHPECVYNGLPGEPILRTGDQNTPDAPPGSGPAATQNYMYSDGTSMSTPLVAGAAALIRQYLTERRNHTPSAALLKAIIINGAVNIGAGVPNNDQGWGRVNIKNAIFPQPLERVQFADNPEYAVATGEDREFHIWVSDNSQPFQATLVWTDYPGNNLQNKLYLRVTDADGVVHKGDVSAYPNPKNNVQKVIINNPPLGEYTITVHGTEVTRGIPAFPGEDKQDFALVVSNGLGYSKNPIDVVQVIDRSGSMDFYNYMEPAKERAKQFIDIMQINDRAGVVAFSVPSDPAAPKAESIVSLTPITSFDDKLTARDLINTKIASDGRTSIGAGLQEGRDQLAVTDGQPHSIILLSDGFENEPPWVADIMPTIPGDTVIYTIGLGITADHVLLQDIAAARSGTYYQILDDNKLYKLHEIYYDIQALASGISLIELDSAEVGKQQKNEHPIDVDSSTDEIIFAASWDDKRNDIEFCLIDPKGNRIVPATKWVRFIKGSTYKYYIVSKPISGQWRMVISNKEGQQQSVQYTISAMGDSEVRFSPGIKVIEKKGKLLINVKLQGEKIKRAKLFADVTYLSVPIKELLEKHKNELDEIKVNSKKLKGDVIDNEDIFKLRLLNRKYWRDNRMRLFSYDTINVPLKGDGEQNYEGYLDMGKIRGGFVTIKLRAAGIIEGSRFSRERLISVASIKEKPVKKYRVKVHIDKVKILEDHDPWWWGQGEIWFKCTTTTGDSDKKANVIRLPRKGIYKISDRSGRNIKQIDEYIFDGEVSSQEKLEIKIEGIENPDDYFEVYRREFTGDPSSWAGIYKPYDEPIDRESLRDWRVWYKIEVNEVNN